MKVGDKISGHTITKIFIEFPILHKGWELDEVGYLVEYKRDGKTKIAFALSDHDNFELVLDSEYLDDKIREYQKAIEQTSSAIAVFRNKS